MWLEAIDETYVYVCLYVLTWWSLVNVFPNKHLPSMILGKLTDYIFMVLFHMEQFIQLIFLMQRHPWNCKRRSCNDWLVVLLVLGVLDWNDCLNEKSAWDTLAWFAILVGTARQLTNLGIVNWMSDCVANSLRSLSLSWPASLLVLQAAYFFIHYLFRKSDRTCGGFIFCISGHAQSSWCT